MKLFGVCIRDSAADAYHAPLFFPALGMAERWFRDECRSQTSEIAKHPSDYELYLVCGFESADGSVDETQVRRLIIRGVDAVGPSSNGS